VIAYADTWAMSLLLFSGVFTHISCFNQEKEVIILDSSIGMLLLIQVILIALNAIFACAEIAVLSVSDTKLNKLSEQGNKKAKRLSKLTAEPAKFLATIQVAITLSGFLGSAFAADNFSDPLVDWLIGLGVTMPAATLNSIVVILITLILSYFTLVFGELVPKRIAMKKSEQLALGISGLVSGISTLFAPLVWLLTISTNACLRLIGIDPNESDEEVSEEEIRMMVDAGSENGAIDDDEKEFIQNIFEFDDLTAGEIATHRTDVVALWMEDTMDDWAATIHDSRHTLYPICEDSHDHVVGILNAKDYFRMSDKSRDAIMASCVKAPWFVPETIKADVLFRNMKKTRNSLAVVLDEYGGMVGIVTINDLVEELVGDLGGDEDEQANNEPTVRKIGDNLWEITGNIDLRVLEDETGIDFDDEHYDTFTGFVFDTLGMIPQDGKQEIELEADGLKIHVNYIEDHQIVSSTVELLSKEEPEEEE